MKFWVFLGSLNMVIAIALGAFGAHGLKGKISKQMFENWTTGAHYHIIHALALLFIGLLILKANHHTSLVSLSGWLILIGILLFSGSLYVMALTNIKTFGAITPFGGFSFIIAWLLIAYSAWKSLS